MIQGPALKSYHAHMPSPIFPNKAVSLMEVNGRGIWPRRKDLLITSLVEDYEIFSSYTVVCPHLGQPAMTSSFTKYKFCMRKIVLQKMWIDCQFLNYINFRIFLKLFS